MSYDLKLDTSGLLSKFGFSDGDILIDWAGNREDVVSMARGSREPPEWLNANIYEYDAALVDLVQRFILPVLDQKVEWEVIGTSHNPIRAISVDGLDIDVIFEKFPKTWPSLLTPKFVTIPEAEVIAALVRARKGKA